MAGDLKDYLPLVLSTAIDYTTTSLDITPHDVVVENIDISQDVIEMDDENVTVITHSGQAQVSVTLKWDGWLSTADSQTIIDFWANPLKAKGRARTFKWPHVTDGVTYKARFMTPIQRTISNTRKISQVTLRLEGYLA